ncbi:unnamed protein product [Camellia sinensis]
MFSAVSHMDLDSGFLSLENFKAALSSIQRQPKVECLKGLCFFYADGSRLFSCGTGKDGDSFLVEWNESEGAIKRTYSGFRKKSVGVVQFDTTQNHFLAVGEDHQIKFWNMDNNDILTSMDAEGGLPSLPRLRFNKEGNLLAVTTADNGIKILATTVGLRSLRVVEAPSFEALRSPIESAAVKNGVDPMDRNMEKPKTLDDVTDKTKTWQLAKIIDPAHCRQVTMPDNMDAVNKVLLYTNSGFGVLALGPNGIQKLWKWTRSEQNLGGKNSELGEGLKATANVVPQQWQPNSGLVMTNDVTGVNLEEAVPCIALSKNDSYVMSAYGGNEQSACRGVAMKGDILEDPANEPNKDMYMMTIEPEDAPNQPICTNWDGLLPVSVNGKEFSPASLLSELNEIEAEQGTYVPPALEEDGNMLNMSKSSCLQDCRHINSSNNISNFKEIVGSEENDKKDETAVDSSSKKEASGYGYVVYGVGQHQSRVEPNLEPSCHLSSCY